KDHAPTRNLARRPRSAAAGRDRREIHDRGAEFQAWILAMTKLSLERKKWSVRSQAAIVVAMFALAVGAVLFSKADRGRASPEIDIKSQTKRDDGKFYPTAA